MSTSEPSAMRQGISRASRPLLVRLHRLPRPVFALVLVALIAVAALAPLPAALPAGVIVVIASGWLSYLSWPVLSGGGKAVRVLVVLCLVALVASRYYG